MDKSIPQALRIRSDLHRSTIRSDRFRCGRLEPHHQDNALQDEAGSPNCPAHWLMDWCHAPCRFTTLALRFDSCFDFLRCMWSAAGRAPRRRMGPKPGGSRRCSCVLVGRACRRRAQRRRRVSLAELHRVAGKGRSNLDGAKSNNSIMWVWRPGPPLPRTRRRPPPPSTPCPDNRLSTSRGRSLGSSLTTRG